MWAIAGLSVLVMAVVLWKLYDLTRLGIWARRSAERAADAWVGGRRAKATGGGLRGRVLRHAMALRLRTDIPDDIAREETTRVARQGLARARSGLRLLDLIATIAPLVGLLGTVLGMIEAFQALQEAGNRADPSALAGGIWQALLTTAAGMAVAIPASVALVWFESIVEGLQSDLEDLATRIFTAPRPEQEAG
jgi:biopolymer transport protein ExbB